PIVAEESLASRWAQLTSWFQTYIVNSTPEQRERAMAAVGDWLLSVLVSVRDEATGPRWWRFWLVAAVVVAAPVAARRAWRRWRQAPAGGAALVEFQARL